MAIKLLTNQAVTNTDYDTEMAGLQLCYVFTVYGKTFTCGAQIYEFAVVAFWVLVAPLAEYNP